MIAQIMQYCKNHFWRSRERNNFTIVTDGIEGTFCNTYLVGQYVHIVGSYINDGVYKVTGVTTSKLTLDATLLAEDTDDFITLYGCAVPADFLTIVSDIEAWVTSNGGKDGVASESIDSYSISFGTGSDGSTGNNWKSAFSGRLTAYKQVFETYDDIGR